MITTEPKQLWGTCDMGMFPVYRARCRSTAGQIFEVQRANFGCTGEEIFVILEGESGRACPARVGRRLNSDQWELEVDMRRNSVIIVESVFER